MSDYAAELKEILSRYADTRGAELLREAMARQAEAEAERKLCLELVSAGYKMLAVKLHPDKVGSLADMTGLVAARDRLRRMLAPPPSLKKHTPSLKKGKHKVNRTGKGRKGE
jgi:hypothetical protein